MKSSEIRIFHLLTSLETIPKNWLTFIAIGAVFIIGYIDYRTGFELSISFFYLIPIAWVAWIFGRVPGWLFLF